MLVLPIEEIHVAVRLVVVAVMLVSVPIEHVTVHPARTKRNVVLVRLGLLALRVVATAVAFVVALLFLAHPY